LKTRTKTLIAKIDYQIPIAVEIFHLDKNWVIKKPFIGLIL